MIKFNKPTIVSIWSAMVSRLCVRLTSKMYFLKIVQVTMKYDPSNAIVEIYVNFTSIILHSHTQLVPRALCEANLDGLPFFDH
jgi:hypothetical protein